MNSEDENLPQQSDSGPADAAAPDRKLPFSKWWPFIAGALYGILLRLTFSDQRHPGWGAMHSAFIIFGPLAVGAVTVYVAERSARRSWHYYLIAGMLANF